MWLPFRSKNKQEPLQLAEQFVRQGKFDAAIYMYQKAIDTTPDSYTIINTLGDLYARLGRNEEAIACYTRICLHYRENGFLLKAIAMYKKISKLEPYNNRTALN